MLWQVYSVWTQFKFSNHQLCGLSMCLSHNDNVHFKGCDKSRKGSLSRGFRSQLWLYWTLLNHLQAVTSLRLPCENHYLFHCQYRTDGDSHGADTPEHSSDGAAFRWKRKQRVQRQGAGGGVNYPLKIQWLVVPTAGGCFNKSSHFLSIQMQSKNQLFFFLFQF